MRLVDISILLGSTIAAIFVLSSTAKALSPQKATAAVARMPGLSHGGAVATTWILILLEGIVGVALIAGFKASFTLAAAGLLLSVLGVGSFLSARTASAQGEDCGCLGAAVAIRIDTPVSVFNVCLGCAALLGGAVSGGYSASGRGYWVVVGTGLVAGLVYWVTLYARSVIGRMPQLDTRSEPLT